MPLLGCEGISEQGEASESSFLMLEMHARAIKTPLGRRGNRRDLKGKAWLTAQKIQNSHAAQKLAGRSKMERCKEAKKSRARGVFLTYISVLDFFADAAGRRFWTAC